MSRLDRLVTLLDTGSTQLVRNTAASQLADVQKAHPDDLFNLLNRIVPFLRKKNWETRTAAAKAISGIVENAEQWEPNKHDPEIKEEIKQENGDAIVKKEDDFTKPSLTIKVENGKNNYSDFLAFETLDVVAVIKNGKKLLGSSGKEYDYSFADLDPAERLALQKKNVTARLGLGGEYMEDELVSETDFVANSGPLPTPRIDTSVGGIPFRQPIHSPAIMTPGCENGAPMTPNEDANLAGLSKRQQNMLKRKAKMSAKNHASKVRVVDLATPSRRPSMADMSVTTATPHPVKQEGAANGDVTDYFSLSKSEKDDDTKVVAEFKGAPVIEQAIPTGQGYEWPFERLCDLLKVDMFDQNWEIRHGALMALREIIRFHGKGAGRELGKSRAENDALNKRWLDDFACRLCCIFMLDKFGDFVSDNVVAPIRETTAQTMGALLKHLTQESVLSIYRTLYRLVMQNDLEIAIPIWEVCHGGMLGLKYLVAVRSDLLSKNPELLDGIVQAVVRGLADHDDDVRAVSAATLVPIAHEFITLRPEAVEGLINVVWECLTHLKDDLSASTGSVMDLLAKLCSFPQVLETMRQNAAKDPSLSFALLVPRLYPFLRHTIVSVRTAVLKALLTFLNIEGDGTKGWIDGKALRLIFQNLLVERNESVLKLSLEVWNALTKQLGDRFATEFASHFIPLLDLLMTPIGPPRHPHPMNSHFFIRPSGQSYSLPPAPPKQVSPKEPENGPPATKRRKKSEKREEPPPTVHNVDGHMMAGDIDLVGADTIMKTKIAGAKAMGLAMAMWPSATRLAFFADALTKCLDSPYSTAQLVACMVFEEYFRECKDGREEPFLEALRNALEAPRTTSYRDHVPHLIVVRSQCQSMLATLRDASRTSNIRIPTFAVVVQGDAAAGTDAFSLETADNLVGETFTKLKRQLPAAAKIMTTTQLSDARNSAVEAIAVARKEKEIVDTRIRAAAAACFVAANSLPKKVGGIVKSLMESVKVEENLDLQTRSSHSVARLVEELTATRRNSIGEKVTRNLCAFLCVDTSEVPEFHHNKQYVDNILSLRKEEDRKDHPDPAQFEKDAKAARVKRRGAKEALEKLCEMFGPKLFEVVPSIRDCIETSLKTALAGDDISDSILEPGNQLGQEVVDGMSTLRALLPKFHPELYPYVIELFPIIKKAMGSRFSVLRYAAAKCFATVCSVITIQGMTTLVEQVLPMLANAGDLRSRQGAVECVYHLIHVMDTDVLPYVVFLIVPILGRMSDSDNDIRLIATTTFATLVKLVPLEAGIPDPPGLSEELLKGRDRERKFIAQMLDVHKVEAFELPVAIKATLRSYQQEGVNWLAFLNKYHLHGILCDDMGLGKTLQTICIVASDHHLRAVEYAKTKAAEVRNLPSLIVCPPTLSGHWQQEISTYAPFLTSLAYVGGPAERARVRAAIGTTDIVITSYDICRNDIDVISQFDWNYCVLDEGHIIKNSKAKLTQAVKRVRANHRLILSGTPIQNNVLELWSLFDFLMPGFLGTEKVFMDRFARPIAASRFSKSSSKEQEAGALAIEALHKQVLPFLLRRLKEEVLDDLPPKIIQNYYCDLSDLQKRLYEDFNKKQSKKIGEIAGAQDKAAKQHIFQALQYMRKLCNSPALVLNEKHPQYQAVTAKLARDKTSVRDPVHAPKLFALRDLLLDCGIGVDNTKPKEEEISHNAISQHRALIFFQLKEMLDIVENDVLKKLLPTVTYLRMDGGTEARKRQDIVTKFNGDPSIDLLLLTTHVGGLGLNLTGADTVIFVEHDWNPQKDMQAMDRAHRIGQKKVVNVYRLVTRGTLEEKIMSLQRFKLDVASTVVNQQNAGLATMETDQILDLFNIGDVPVVEGAKEDEGAVDVDGNVIRKGQKGVLEDLGELWDEGQYDEYDLESFIAGLKE